MTFFNSFVSNTISSGVNLVEQDLVFDVNGTESSSINIWGFTILKLFIPADFVGTSVTIELSNDDSIFFPYDNVINEPVIIQTTPGRCIGLAPIDMLGSKYVRLVSSDPEVNAPTVTAISMGMK